MDSSRDKEAKKVAKIIDMVPTVAAIYASDSADEPSYRHISKWKIGRLVKGGEWSRRITYVVAATRPSSTQLLLEN
jgi:hypothetical protein